MPEDVWLLLYLHCDYYYYYHHHYHYLGKV